MFPLRFAVRVLFAADQPEFALISFAGHCSLEFPGRTLIYNGATKLDVFAKMLKYLQGKVALR